MSNDATIEHRLSLVENATDTLIKNTDRIQADLRTLQAGINQRFNETQQTLNLLIEMYQAQKAVLDRMDSRLIAMEHNLELQYKLIEQRIPPKHEGPEETYDA